MQDQADADAEKWNRDCDAAEDEEDELRKELGDTRREMKARGIRRISCFNGGLSSDEHRFNARLFELNTKLKAFQ